MGSAAPAFSFDTSSTIPLWLNGKPITTGDSFDIISPLTEKVLYKAAAASEKDALAAVDAAAAAQEAWAATKPSSRRDLFLRAADELVRRKDELWHYCSTETGSTEPYFAFDFNDALESLRSCAGLIHTASVGQTMPVGEEGRSAMLVPEPYGVVVSIAPWNAPCILGLRSFLGPLASKYTVQLRLPDTLTRCSGQYSRLERPRKGASVLLDASGRLPKGRLASRMP